MNLLEKGSPEDEDFPMDDIDSLETGIQTDKKKILIACGVFFALVLLILIFGIWYKSKRKIDNTEAVNKEVSQYIEKRDEKNNKDNLIIDNASVEASIDSEQENDLSVEETAIVVEEEKGHEEVDVLLNQEQLKDPLDQDMDYEDYSYEKEYIMKELSGWWDNAGTAAVYDLSALRRYRKLSYGLRDSNQFYYYGETDSNGNPNGKGTALYGDDTYYFGEFVHGKKEGKGYWMRFYYNSKNPYAMNGKITMHSYAGEWKDNLPDGEGQEHFDVDVSKLADNDDFFQNVIGGFSAGRYHGEMYANSINEEGEITEWDGVAKNGEFELIGILPPSGENPIWKSRSDNPRIRRIGKDENKDCGIKELYLEK